MDTLSSLKEMEGAGLCQAAFAAMTFGIQIYAVVGDNVMACVVEAAVEADHLDQRFDSSFDQCLADERNLNVRAL